MFNNLICFIQTLILIYPNVLRSVKFGQFCQVWWIYTYSSQWKLKEKINFGKIHIEKMCFSTANFICLKFYSDLRFYFWIFLAISFQMWRIFTFIFWIFSFEETSSADFNVIVDIMIFSNQSQVAAFVSFIWNSNNSIPSLCFL